MDADVSEFKASKNIGADLMKGSYSKVKESVSRFFKTLGMDILQDEEVKKAA